MQAKVQTDCGSPGCKHSAKYKPVPKESKTKDKSKTKDNPANLCLSNLFVKSYLRLSRIRFQAPASTVLTLDRLTGNGM
ncbi:hypothetical protein E4U52_006235 [Claviceps spartinae]|nr:hypothetical protein E4U52_006235 [Claviceps spartinae]